MLKNIFDKFDTDVKDLIKGSGTTFFIRIIGILLLYVFTIIVTNNLGATVYGEFAFFVLSLKLISLFTTAGVDTYLLRYISDDPQENKISRLVGNGTITVVFNSCLILLIVFILAQFHYETFFTEYWYVTLLIIGVLPFSISKLNAQSFRAKKNTIMYSIIEFTALPFFAILYFYILNSKNQHAPVLAYTLATLSVFVISMFKWQFKYRSKILKNLVGHFKEIKKTNKVALPFLIAGSSIYLGQWGVSLMLKYFEGNDILGNFDAAIKIGNLLMMPLVASATIIAPILSRKFATNDKKGLERILKISTNAIFFLTIPLIIITYLFSNEIMALYGPDFAHSGNILRIILIGFSFNVLSGPISVLLQMAEKQVIVQNVFLLSSLFNIAACAYLIPKYGVIGACWSNVIYQIAINGYLLIYLKLKFGYLSFGK